MKLKTALDLIQKVGYDEAIAMLSDVEITDESGNVVEIKSLKPKASGDNADLNKTVKEAVEGAVKAAMDGYTKASRKAALDGELEAKVVKDRIEDDPKWGWKHAGEFGAAVVKTALSGKMADDRLKLSTKASLSTYTSEAIGEDGGFAAPPEFAQQIMSKIAPGDSLAARCNRINTSRNVYVMTKDETTPWQSSGGILAYWDGEADTVSQSKVKLKQDVIRLNKLTALVPITDEAAEDAPALMSFINQKAPEKLNFKLDLAILQGTGAGQPLGLLNAPATISVAKVASQAADTIVALNILTMLNRQYARSRPNAVWVAHQDTEVQLQTLMKVGKLDTGAADTGWGTTIPFFTYDANGVPRLANKPVIFHEACETVGDLGDIFLADFTQYDLLTKVGGIRAESSIHLWFDQSTTALRFVMRVAGQPSWSAAASARDGSATYSPFVTLAVRA